MATATQAPPATQPPSVTAPKPGPSTTAVNMPAPPSVDTAAPSDAPGKSADAIDFEQYARPAEEVLTTPNVTPRKKAAAPKAEPAKTDEKPTDEPARPEEAEAAVPPEDKETPKTVEPAKTESDAKKGKVNPWKWGEEHKQARLKAEQEIAELRKLIPNETEAKATAERLSAAEKRAQELEDHMRFIDYQNHPEFKSKYEQPYIDKWNSIMKRLNGVNVKDADGQVRKVQPSDIQRLGSLTADQAIEQAEAQFGKLGNWVAERVEELKQLEESKFAAIENARTEGRKWHEQSAAQQKEISGFLQTTWKKAVDEVKQHSKYGKYFNEIEGDAEFNTKLSEGYKKVDEALNGNPADPKLTAEQREKLVRKTAGLRNRAAAFGVLNLTISRLESQLAEANAKLSEYESSTPTTEGQQPNANGHTPPAGYDMNAFEQALAARSRPGVI